MTIYQIWLDFMQRIFGPLGTEFWLIDRIIYGGAIVMTIIFVGFLLFGAFTAFTYRRRF